MTIYAKEIEQQPDSTRQEFFEDAVVIDDFTWEETTIKKSIGTFSQSDAERQKDNLIVQKAQLDVAIARYDEIIAVFNK